MSILCCPLRYALDRPTGHCKNVRYTPCNDLPSLPARCGPHAAVQHVYGCPGLLKAVTRGAPRHAHDALALGVLHALQEGGCGTAGQTDAVLVPAAAAGHVAVAQWAIIIMRGGGI